MNKTHRWKIGALVMLALLAVVAIWNIAAVAAVATTVGSGLLMANAPMVVPKEVTDAIAEIKTGLGKVGTLETDQKAASLALKKIEEQIENQQKELDKLRKQWMTRGSIGGAVRRAGYVTDECAQKLAGQFILHCSRSGKLDGLQPSVRDALITESRNMFGISVKDALTTTEIPLPSNFGSEIRELIADFGVARRELFPYPLGQGTSRPPRMGTRPAFGSIAMSAAIDEKKPTFTFAELSSHKIGGLVRVPRELDDQSIIPLGQFLARYGATEFARAEDTWAFLADGTATYESVVGILPTCITLNKKVVLANTKTAPSDAVIGDFRAMRRKCATPVLTRGKYYLNPTWESRLRDFNTEADPNIFVINGAGGKARLDGYEIVWTDVLPAYSEDASPSTNIALFGDLSFWLFGERGMPRMDQSEHVFFVNDQLAVRFIEELDFDYLAEDAASVLRTAAA